VSNRHLPGRESVGERLESAIVDLIANGEAPEDAGIHWDCPEGDEPDHADEDRLRSELWRLYEGCHWVDIDALVARAYDPATEPEEFRRFYLNQCVSTSTTWVTAAELDANPVATVLKEMTWLSASTWAALATQRQSS
jgi:hypothetical protein